MFDVVEVRWPSEPVIWRRARIWDVSNEGARPSQANNYPLVHKHGKSWKITIFNGKTVYRNYKWSFPIMLNYQRVDAIWVNPNELTTTEPWEWWLD